jgi:hypothetical protein
MTRRLLPVLLLSVPAAGFAADPALEKLLPVPPEVRQVLDRSCVFCHGAVVNGEKETRDQVDLSTDETIRDTVEKAGKMKLYVMNGKMPHKVRLSKRLRDDAALQQRLTDLRAAYDKNGDKEVLLNWLKDVEAAKEEEKKD